MFQKILLLVTICFFGCQNSQNQTLSPSIPTAKSNAEVHAESKSAMEEKKSLAENPTKSPTSIPEKYRFPWLQNYNGVNGLENRIAPPEGYERLPTAANSFSDWLRHLPLKEGHPSVYLFNGAKKGNQNAQYAVINMDVGRQDLQQCADAVMRLRAEYLLATNQLEKIHFNFTNGDKCDYQEWKSGIRPAINGNKVNWSKRAKPDASYPNFKKYMIKVFQFAGTHSLEKELKTVADLKDIEAGDVFIYGGFPGHAVMVMDVAVNSRTGEKVFMLAQSYMPAQEMHILKNPNVKENTPWYAADFEGQLFTPEWTFEQSQLKRF